MKAEIRIGNEETRQADMETLVCKLDGVKVLGITRRTDGEGRKVTLYSEDEEIIRSLLELEQSFPADVREVDDIEEKPNVWILSQDVNITYNPVSGKLYFDVFKE